jgi:glycosyltransferase involved in cell wall biosynthesis
MPDRLRVLHLIDKNRLTTGSVVQMMAAARGFRKLGHRVWVAGPPGGDLEAVCRDADLHYLDLDLRRPVDPASAARLRKHLGRERIQIAHAHKGRAHAAVLLAAAGLGQLPKLVVNRGVSFPLDGFNRWKYRHPRVAAVVCVADAVREVVIRSAGLQPNRVVVIHAGTDISVFDPHIVDGSPVRSELMAGKSDLLVAQISVRDWKGWRELLAAFSAQAPRRPHTSLLLVGCEPAAVRAQIEATALAAGIGAQLLTLPNRTDMPEILAACDVVVDASWAGTGITGTLREAMSMARAVVATDCGGNRELVIDGEVGLLVPPRNADALAGALARLLDDPALRHRLGTTARQRVVDHFTTERRINRLEALYRRVLE